MIVGKPSGPGAAIKCLAILTLFILTRALHAGIAISPAYVEVSLDKGRPSGEFVVTNLGDTVERYRVKSLNFTFSRDGGLQRIEADANSLATWIIFNPKEFDLPPKSKRSIRFVISPHGVPRPGEYTAGMELESLNTMSGSSGKDAGGHVETVHVVTSILVPIFAQIGKIDHKGSVKELMLGTENNNTVLQTVVANQGNGRLLVTGTFEILDGAGKSVATGDLPKCYVLRESERLLSAPLTAPLPDGKYTLKTKVSSTQLDKPMVLETTMDWKNPPAAATKPAPAANAEPAASPAPPAEKAP